MAIEVTLQNMLQQGEEVFALLDGTTVGAFLADQSIATKNVSIQVNDRTIINLNTPLSDGDRIKVSTTKVENGAIEELTFLVRLA